MQDFRALRVWRQAHQLTLSIYRVTASLPACELFGLSSQLRRAVMSIPANIAEGCGRGSDQDFARFVQIAMGSACEVEYLLLLARDLEYIPNDLYEARQCDLEEIKRMLASLIRRLRTHPNERTTAKAQG